MSYLHFVMKRQAIIIPFAFCVGISGFALQNPPCTIGKINETVNISLHKGINRVLIHFRHLIHSQTCLVGKFLCNSFFKSVSPSQCKCTCFLFVDRLNACFFIEKLSFCAIRIWTKNDTRFTSANACFSPCKPVIFGHSCRAAKNFRLIRHCDCFGHL